MIKTILTLLDIKHSIIIDANIGLLGEINYKNDNKTERVLDIRSDTINMTISKRFNVIGRTGAKLFDEFIKTVFIVENSNGDIFYAFEIDGYTVEDNLNSFFGFESEKRAVILYKNDKLYTNCKKLSTKYEYIENIELSDKFIFDNEYYTVNSYNRYNEIFRLIPRRDMLRGKK